SAATSGPATSGIGVRSSFLRSYSPPLVAKWASPQLRNFSTVRRSKAALDAYDRALAPLAAAAASASAVASSAPSSDPAASASPDFCPPGLCAVFHHTPPPAASQP